MIIPGTRIIIIASYYSASALHTIAHAQKIGKGEAEALVRYCTMAGKSNEPEPLLPQLPPRPVRRDRKKENRGGYDCDFVEKPPEAIQTECSVCLLILKEPCLISCCGHKFCRECIEQVTKDAKPCPLCNEPNFNFMRERKLERFLKGSEVWCSYKKEGCEWSGELGQLQEHLNRDPSLENQPNGCAFVAVECTHKCGEWFQRRHIATHQNEQCKKRPYSCDYCRDYASTFEDVIGVHYPQCGNYPVACPNDCDVYKIERQDLESHLRDKCPLALVDCPFHYAGCETQLPRKDMPEHVKETATHLMLLSIKNQKLTKENQQLKERVLEREDESRKSMEAVQASLQKLMEENQELKQSTAASLQELNMKCDSQNENLTDLQQSIQKLEKEKKQQYHKQKITDDKIRALEEEEQLDLINTSERLLELRVKYTEEEVYSPAFYTHPHGYRMCVRVDPKGIGNGKGTHVAIFTCMMCGPFDDYLKWPFRGEITIQLVNQAGGHDHIEQTIPYTDKTPDGIAGRVTGSERATNVRVFFQFVAHTDLGYNAARKTQYLKDNHLIVRVVKVVLK